MSEAVETLKGEDSVQDLDSGTVFPVSRIKTQLQNEDNDIGRLPKKTLQLISSCSALVLQKIVQESLSLKEEYQNFMNKQQDDNEKPVIVLSAEDLKRGVEKNESLHFLKEPIEDAMQLEDGRLAPQKRGKRAAQKAADGGSRNSRKAAKIAKAAPGLDQASLEQIMELSNKPSRVTMQDEIVPDEEDYD